MAKLTPSQYVIKTLGGVSATAKICGLDRSSVSRWRETIPSRHHVNILRAAQRRKLDITEKDLVRGR